MPSYVGQAILLTVVFAAPAFAQTDEPPPAAVLGEPFGRRPLLPLRDYLGSQDEPFRPFAPLGPPPTQAEEGIGTRYGLGLLAGRLGIPGYGLTWVPGQSVSGQPTQLSLVRQDISIFAPIYREGQDTAAIGLGVRNTVFNTDAILPTSRRAFPGTLWDIEAGVAYSHQWDNGWTTGAVVNGGSASNRPFHESNVLVASVALYTTVPTEGPNAWIFGLYYSPTAEFPYPLPILAYFWRPDEELQVNIGLPFYLRWRPEPDWTAELVYLPIRTLQARVTFEPVERFYLYGAFQWMNESYFLADRFNEGDRFFSFEKRLSGGIQFELPYKLRLDVSAGYAFDRFYFQGRRYADRDQDRINVGAGWFGALQLRLQF